MSKKSKTTTGPSKFAQPFIRQGAQTLEGAYNATAPKIQQQTDMVLGGLNPFLMDNLENGNAGVNAAQQYGLDVLAGDYLNNNPYLDQVIDYTNEDIANSVNANMGLRGLTGGSSHAGVLAREIGRNTANLRYGDYARERGVMDSAAGRAGSLAQAEYLPVGGLLSTIQAQQAPLNAASQYAGGLGALLGNSTTTSQPNNWIAGLLGAGLGGWASGGFG